MKRGSWLLLGVIWLALFPLGLRSASGQTPYRRYTSPSGPTITPYLNYFRSDIGGVGDPYNLFIAPGRRLDSALTELRDREQANFQANQRQLETVRQALAAPTGTGASFMNYSHYYSMPRVAPGARQR